jgi:hypothetical protein
MTKILGWPGTLRSGATMARPARSCSEATQSAAGKQLLRRPRNRFAEGPAPINGECFRAYVEQILLPSLKPGDVVIIDNLGSHKSAALRRILRAAGARRSGDPRSGEFADAFA